MNKRIIGILEARGHSNPKMAQINILSITRDLSVEEVVSRTKSGDSAIRKEIVRLMNTGMATMIRDMQRDRTARTNTPVPTIGSLTVTENDIDWSRTEIGNFAKFYGTATFNGSLLGSPQITDRFEFSYQWNPWSLNMSIFNAYGWFDTKGKEVSSVYREG